MSEEGQAGNPPEGTTPAPLADAEGNLRDGWIDAMDEDVRGEKCLATVKTVGGAIKSLVNAQRMVGRDKIIKPSESSTEEEWGEFFKAGGRPETALEYGFVKPEDLPDEYWHEDEMKEIMELFHKIGLSSKQAKAIFDHNYGKMIAMIKGKATQDEIDMNKLKDGLIVDWGNAYEQKKHLGNLALEKASGGNEELKARLVDKYGNDPDLIRAFSNLGNQFAEHGIVETTNIPTPGDLEEQKAEAMRHPAYGLNNDWRKDGYSLVEHNAQIQKVNKIIEQIGKFKTG